eukprot:CAMPEP_0201281888 /NCGR_PEP_ID=MMETSP1317-20130820/4304_1 /ASSEMBLY_ACC=CAM_ASM_000770 /TAXON_ID=187299 /ORGANISM="Undescribed Undescribed, Strain Undescribed" /LENGTH=70 /DNA_ID=CAMNT_0047593045 /DNA_START=26 /DNA_END=235 /DNA_ORIENTATION=-
MGALMGQPDGTLITNIEGMPGALMVTKGEQPQADNDYLYCTIRGTNIKSRDTFSKADAYLVFSKQIANKW